MLSLQFLVPALAVVDVAFAQGSCSGPTTVQNAGDASAIAGCQTYSGDVAIATDAPGQLSFDGQLSEIDGELNAVNAVNVNSMSFGSLQRITKAFHMQNMTVLTNLQMPQLTRVGSLDWQTCPALQGLTFNTGLQTVDTSLSIQDTAIQSLDNINVKGASSIRVANNGRLMSLQWQLAFVNQSLVIASNHINGGLNTSLPNLETAGSIDISNVSALNIPSLSRVDQSVAVYGSYFQSLAFPNLTKSGGLSVNNNNQLSNLSAPGYRQCSGAIRVFNNDNLGGTLSFPSVEQVGGALNLTGSFSSVDMPKLNTVSGVSYIYSSQDISSTCQKFGSGGQLQGQGVLSGGKVSCSSSAKAGGAGTSSGSSSSSSSSGAAFNLGPAPGTAFSAFGLLAAIFGMF